MRAIRCSFCAEKAADDRRLISGLLTTSTAFICEECVRICVEVLDLRPSRRATFAGVV
ncbi:MAG: hypothetical protein E6R03_09455 [Hyphomicrobiaceae bacterium]|nr:MAG: hypothetical protein E6R03_09455 [Hyphomicrobiaceae bacterium]